MPQNPRNHRDWMRSMERNQAQARGMGSSTQQIIERVLEAGEGDTIRHPASPVELSAQSAFHVDTNFRQRVRLILDFPDVRFNTDGTEANVQQYELWGRQEPLVEDPDAEEVPWALLDSSLESSFRTGGFMPGAVWTFRVRALGVNSIEPGEWSEETTVQMLEDTQAPPQPSAPTVEASRGQLIVRWDGLAVTGEMPADFSYAVLAQGSTSSPTTEVARFGRGGGFQVITGAAYYEPQFFRISAVDDAGNMSPWSQQAVEYTSPLVDTDVVLSTIDAAKTALINVDARESILSGTIITEHLVVTEEMTAAIANFLTVNADMINANSIWADEAFFGLADALLFRGDAFEGKTFTGGVFTGSTFQTTLEANRGVTIDDTGIRVWSPSGVRTMTADAATGDLSIVGGTFTGGVFQTRSTGKRIILTDRAGDGSDIRFYGPTGTDFGQLQYLTVSEQGGTAGADLLRFAGPGGAGRLDAYRGGDIQMQGKSVGMYATSGGNVRVGDNRVDTFGQVYLMGPTSNQTVLYVNSYASSGVEAAFQHFGTTTGVVGSIPASGNHFGVIAVGRGLFLHGSQILAPPIWETTSGAGVNVGVGSNGVLYRSTSALKYKILPEVVDLPEGLLEVPMKDWVDRSAAENYASMVESLAGTQGPLRPGQTRMDLAGISQADFDAVSLKRIPGAIAEEVEAFGGGQFVVYGPDGDIEGLMYDRLALARTQLLNDKLTAVLERIEALECG